ncbi:MAG: transcriptional regulator, TetR family [Oscillospiraceae bacterium]|jgi:AcrR family transcriptional regulator|nr:transcriptional regulator, TetR family [Oscillospiraceae bacterium]
MGIREEQKEKRREEILAAGLDLFIRKGYASTKVSDIAEHVGMSVGLLFHYFESKEKLYEELVRLGISGPMNVMASTDIEPLQFFEGAARRIFHAIQTEPFVAKMFVLMSQVFYNEAAPQSIKDLLQGFDIYTPTTQLIQKGQANGTIREGDPYALTIAYWCAIQGIAEQVALTPDSPCPESSWIVDIIRRKDS